MSAMAAPPAMAAAAICTRDRPSASRARTSPRARTGASAPHAPTAAQTGVSGSVRPARSPQATPPSSVAAVMSQASPRASPATTAARTKTTASQRVTFMPRAICGKRRATGGKESMQTARRSGRRNARACYGGGTARLDFTVPRWFGSGSPLHARRESVPRAPQTGNTRCGSVGPRPIHAKPTGAGPALEEENVMQSTDGSRPKGLLT